MSSIIDLMRTVPLFRGVTRDVMGRTVGAIPFHFNSFRAGDDIAVPGAPHAHLLVLLSGAAGVVRYDPETEITVTMSFQAPCTILADTLFGSAPTHVMNIRAIEDCSVALVSKPHFLQLLALDPIFNLNYILDLTSAARRSGPWLPLLNNHDLTLRRWLASLWLNGGNRLTVHDPAGKLPAMLGIPGHELRRIIAEDHLGNAESMTYTDPRKLLQL